MSKNLTRKGLALGAAVALGSTLFAGAPAFAAEALTVAADKGTSTSFISGERFDLKVFPGTGSAFQFASSSELRWEVLNPDAKSVTVTGTDANTDTASDVVVTPSTNPSTATTITVDPTDGARTNPGGNKLGLEVAADVETTLKVRAYIENDGTAGLTAGDSIKSEQIEVKFIKQANVTASIAITAPVEGDTKVAAKLSFSNINNEQLAEGDFGLEFTKGDGNPLSNTAAEIQRSVAAWSTTTSSFAGETATIGALVKGEAVKVQAYYKKTGTVTWAAAEKIGAAATANITTRTIATATADVVRSTNALAKNTASINAAGSPVQADPDTAYVLRNSTFKVKLSVKDGSTTPKAVAGLAVTAKVTTSASLGTESTSKSVTVAGTKYTDATKLPGGAATGAAAKVSTTTDADGVAYVEISTANFVENDSLAITFYAENFERTVNVHALGASYSGYLVNVNGSKVSTVDGTAAAVQVAVRDQFGAAIGSGYKAQAVWDASGSGYSAQPTAASTDATATSADIVDGKATLTILDNGTGAGVNNYDIKFAKVLSNGGLDTPVVVLNDLNVAILSSVTPGAVKLTATDGGTALGKNTAETANVLAAATRGGADAKVGLQTGSTVSFGNYDARSASATAPSVSTASTDFATVFGTVTTASSATVAAVAIPNGQVTVSGAGLQFEAVYGLNSVWGKDTLTFNAEADGTFTVKVYGQKAGVQTVTFTSGAATSKLELSFAAAAETAGASVALTAPATIEPGKTITVTGVLTDKFGNAVDTNQGGSDARLGTSTFSVAYDGPGLIVGDLPAKTDADGKFAFRVLLGASDTGSATVTVKYDADGSTTTTTDAVTKTASITIAAPVVVAPEVKTTIVGVTKAVRIRVENAKGEEVEVKFGSKTVAVAIAGTNSKLWVLKTTKGKKSVKVYVDGDLVAVKTVTVK